MLWALGPDSSLELGTGLHSPSFHLHSGVVSHWDLREPEGLPLGAPLGAASLDAQEEEALYAKRCVALAGRRLPEDSRRGPGRGAVGYHVSDAAETPWRTWDWRVS